MSGAMIAAGVDPGHARRHDGTRFGKQPGMVTTSHVNIFPIQETRLNDPGNPMRREGKTRP